MTQCFCCKSGQNVTPASKKYILKYRRTSPIPWAETSQFNDNLATPVGIGNDKTIESIVTRKKEKRLKLK